MIDPAMEAATPSNDPARGVVIAMMSSGAFAKRLSISPLARRSSRRSR
jgi:hypothetical protein